MTVTAIIVNYQTSRLVNTLCGHLGMLPEVSAIVVVDNSGEMERVESGNSRAGVELIRSPSNIGFGRGVNAGIRRVRTEWVLVINPDVRLGTSCLRHLLDAADQFDAVLTGPRFYWDDQHQFRLPPATGDSMGMKAGINAASRFALDARLAGFYWQIRHERFWSASQPFFEPFLSGACLLVHMPWIRKKDGLLFDERFFLYYEDTDLCVNALLSDEYPLCVPAAEALHYYNQSPALPETKGAAMAASERQFHEKYYPGQQAGTLSVPPRANEIEDMGPAAAPPRFPVETGCWSDSAFFEIGTNPLFIPFAQSRVAEGEFRFPDLIWQRLAPGRYYSRIRNPYTNQERVWQWEKTAL